MRKPALLMAALAVPGAAALAQDTPDWYGVDGFEFITPATVFRFTDLDLRDPHVYLPIALPPPLPSICSDFTDTPIPTTSTSFNGSIQASYSADADPADGVLDSSSLLWFRPLRRDGAIARVDNGGADCLAPAPPASCSASVAASPTAYVYASATLGTCLAPLPGSTGAPPYSPAITTPAGPCFVTAAKTFSFDNAGTLITLIDAQIAASFVGDPATGLSNGLLRGFLRESDANQILINNASLPGGSVTLASLLAGGAGSCSARNDKDTHLGESGWWFYFNFSAEPVTYTGP
jgi:hypothetical protein